MGMSSGDGPAGDRQEMITPYPNRQWSGFKFFDTAEVYGPFVNRELVGEALAIPWRGDDRD